MLEISVHPSSRDPSLLLYGHQLPTEGASKVLDIFDLATGGLVLGRPNSNGISTKYRLPRAPGKTAFFRGESQPPGESGRGCSTSQPNKPRSSPNLVCRSPCRQAEVVVLLRPTHPFGHAAKYPREQSHLAIRSFVHRLQGAQSLENQRLLAVPFSRQASVLLGRRGHHPTVCSTGRWLAENPAFQAVRNMIHEIVVAAKPPDCHNGNGDEHRQCEDFSLNGQHSAVSSWRNWRASRMITALSTLEASLRHGSKGVTIRESSSGSGGPSFNLYPARPRLRHFEVSSA